MNTHHDDASVYQGRRRLTIEDVPGLAEDDGPPPFGSARVEPRRVEPTIVMPGLDGTDEEEPDHEDAHEELLSLRNAQIDALAQAYRCQLRAHFEVNAAVRVMYEEEQREHEERARLLEARTDAAQARLDALMTEATETAVFDSSRATHQSSVRRQGSP